MPDLQPCFSLRLSPPEWLPPFLSEAVRFYQRPSDRMRLVLELAQRNIQAGSGGPFAAAVFATQSGQLISAAVNTVVPAQCSIAHAEMLALALAQQRLKTHNLAAPHLPSHQLVSSAEPCAMCLGAIPWSGIRSLVCGARSEDVEAIGFQEGDKPENWPACLEAKGIHIERDCLRDKAAQLLEEYARSGGAIYNGQTS